MKEALRYLNQYADEVEDEGMDTLADAIRECAVSLKDLEPNPDPPEVPSVVSNDPATIKYQSEQWVQKRYLSAREGAWVQRVERLEKEITRTRGSNATTFDPSRDITASVSRTVEPNTFAITHEMRVRFTSDMLDMVKNQDDVFQFIVQKMADEFQKLMRDKGFGRYASPADPNARGWNYPAKQEPWMGDDRSPF
jgi:hypothetical protein